MAILGVMNEFDGGTSLSGLYEVNTSGTYHDAAYTRCALVTDYDHGFDTGGYRLMLTDQTKTTVWIRFRGVMTYNGNTFYMDGDWFRIYDTSGNELLAADFLDGNCTFTYHNGSARVGFGPTWSPASGTTYFVDIELNLHATAGRFAIYIGNSEFASYEGQTNYRGGNPISWAQLAIPTASSISAAEFQYISEVVAADESTIGWRVATLPATADAATANWTGTYTAIDEIGLDDNDRISATSAALEHRFTSTATLPADTLDVKAVVVSARSITTGTGPANIRMQCKSGATLGQSGLIALKPWYQGIQYAFETDPNTGSAWTKAAVEASEFGVKSET